MARRQTSVLLAAIIVVARLVGGGAMASASVAPSEVSVRAELGLHTVPARKVRSLAGHHARPAARNEALSAWLASLPDLAGEPTRTLVPPTVRPAVAQIVARTAPSTRARGPPPR